MNNPKVKTPTQSPCPCQGGQSCIVDRRLLNDIVYEDILFTQHKLRLRKNCLQPYTNSQQKLLTIYVNTHEFFMNL